MRWQTSLGRRRVPSRAIPAPKCRIAQFLKIALKWYGVASLTVLIAVTPAGLWFFSKHGTTQVQWVLPWILLSSCSALSLLILPFVAVLEGCGRVADVATMRLGQNVTASLLCWLALAMHWSLLAYPLFAAASLGWQVVWLSARARYFFLDILRVRWSHSIVSWRREVWPFQWRIALTWLSSYFVSQFFNPVLFAFHGPGVAGQMGMSLGVANALLATGVTWMNTKCAPMGTLVARTEFPALDRMFFATMRNSFLLLLTGATAVFTVVLFVNSRHMPIATRLLPPLPMLLLLATTLASHVVQCEAMYLRAHKREPLLPLALLTGATTGLLTYYVGRRYGATGVTVAYFATTVFLSVTGSTLIFRRKQKAWHRTAAGSAGPHSNAPCSCRLLDCSSYLKSGCASASTRSCPRR